MTKRKYKKQRLNIEERVNQSNTNRSRMNGLYPVDSNLVMPAVRWVKQLESLLLATVVAAVMSMGCSEGFDPFNEVDRFRVLGMQSDPPALREGETAVVSALIHTTNNAPLTYEWSWCPIAASSQNGGECVVTEDMLLELAEMLVTEQLGEDASAVLDDFDFDFDLGTGETATFIYALPKDVLSEVCRLLISEEIPSFTGIPQCDSSFDVVIRLNVTQGDKTLKAVKRIPLIIDESRMENNNPEVLDVSLTDADGNAVSDRLEEGVWYDIVADIPESAVDRLLPSPTADNPDPEERDETLFMTWYVTGGSTDVLRTSYIEDEVSLSVLRKNQWRAPFVSDLDDGTVSLYLVIQDEQGGAGWFERTFRVEED